MFKELEFKYRADSVKLSDFKALMGTLKTRSTLQAYSWDVYYVQDGNFDSFQRLRLDPFKPELTKKVKTQDANNWFRIESDLPLDPARLTTEKVAVHVGLDGYRENFRIFKCCDIYFTDELTYVFYVVFNHEMVEIGRFIEVEVDKDFLYLAGEEEAKVALLYGEQDLKVLAISPQNRLKKSLFELFRKEVP